MTEAVEPIKSFATQRSFETWLRKNHERSEGLWLKIAKQGSSHRSISYAEAVEVALCFGWIDGQKGRIDDEWWKQKFTARRARSPWSQINREKALDLIARGLMQPAGAREVERAKADGRWDAAYAGAASATVPDDLQAALADDPRASKAFAVLDSTNRYAILYRVQDAKRPETRARRIAQYVAMLSEGRKIHERRA